MFLRPIRPETTNHGTFLVWEYQQTNALLGGVDVQTIGQSICNGKYIVYNGLSIKGMI